MSKGVLLLGGAGPHPRFWKRMIGLDDVVCAADSGLDAAVRAGVPVHGVVGDMDSLSDVSLLEQFSPEQVEVHPADKDDTDAVLGIRWLRQRGCTELVLMGGGEGRIDHWACLWALFRSETDLKRWYTAREELRRMEPGEPCSLAVQAGEVISVFPAGTGPWRIRTEGLHWPLDRVDWPHGEVSLSNRTNSRTLEWHLTEGSLILVRSLDAVFAYSDESCSGSNEAPGLPSRANSSKSTG